MALFEGPQLYLVYGRASTKGRNLAFVPVRRYFKPVFIRVHFVLRPVRSYIFAIIGYFLGPSKNQTLCHRLGIKMPSKISAFFTEASRKVKKKINVRTKRCVTVRALKCHQIFLAVFLLKLHETSRTNSM